MSVRGGLHSLVAGNRGRTGRGPWPRLISTLLLVGLLVATAGAFAVTERLKLTRSPITGVLVTKIFSPVCSCRTVAASIAFRLRHADRISVAVERGGKVVRTLVRNVVSPALIGLPELEERLAGLGGIGIGRSLQLLPRGLGAAETQQGDPCRKGRTSRASTSATPGGRLFCPTRSGSTRHRPRSRSSASSPA